METLRTRAQSILWIAVCLTLIMFTSTTLQLSPASASSTALNLGKLVHLRIASSESDYPIRDVYVLTPALKGIDPVTLPVVYMLHGWSGSPAGMISAVQKPLALAFSQGTKPFIAVFPDGNAKTHPDSEWADSSDKKAMVETWLTKKVIPTVEAGRIRTKSERAIFGFSMGGYGAAIIALHHPTLFGQVVSIAGYFITDDISEAFSGVKKIAYQSPSTFLKVAKNFRWYLAEGLDDFTQPIRGQAVLWSMKLKSVKAPVALVKPSGGHSFVVVSNQIASITQWMKWPAITHAVV